MSGLSEQTALLDPVVLGLKPAEKFVFAVSCQTSQYSTGCGFDSLSLQGR